MQNGAGLNDPSQPCCWHTLTKAADGSLDLTHQQKKRRKRGVCEGGEVGIYHQDEGKEEGGMSQQVNRKQMRVPNRAGLKVGA